MKIKTKESATFRKFEIGKILTFWRSFRILIHIKITDFYPKLNEKWHSRKIWLQIWKAHVFLRKETYVSSKTILTYDMSSQNSAESRAVLFTCKNISVSSTYRYIISYHHAFLILFWMYTGCPIKNCQIFQQKFWIQQNHDSDNKNCDQH